MFSLLWKTVKVGVVTDDYPAQPAQLGERFRGRPDVDPALCDGCGSCAQVCPTRVISLARSADQTPARLTIDLAGCIFCGECAARCPRQAIRMTREYELASRDRDRLVMELDLCGTADCGASDAAARPAPPAGPAGWPSLAAIGAVARERIGELFGRSLHIREVSAGCCNACDCEASATTNPIFDIGRFGVHFVASPRYADMLLVTGPVSRNMARPLVEAYNACPEPKLVLAVGACACSGGVFGASPQTMGGVDRVIPVNTYVPGCPPKPQAIIHGILLTLEREKERFSKIRRVRAAAKG